MFKKKVGLNFNLNIQSTFSSSILLNTKVLLKNTKMFE